MADSLGRGQHLAQAAAFRGAHAVTVNLLGAWDASQFRFCQFPKTVAHRSTRSKAGRLFRIRVCRCPGSGDTILLRVENIYVTATSE